MKLAGTLLAVTDIEKSKKFYKEVLGLHVIMDLGANAVLTGGLSLQTEDTWKEFIDAAGEEIFYNAKDSEIYFEEDHFDTFIEKLEKIKALQYVHPVKEHSWGQRVVRFFDPDKHIIEVGENIKAVCMRFLESGMTVEEVCKRMDVPAKFVNGCIRKK